MSCIVGTISADEAIEISNNIILNDLIMTDSRFDSIDKLTLLKVPYEEKLDVVESIIGEVPDKVSIAYLTGEEIDDDQTK